MSFTNPKRANRERTYQFSCENTQWLAELKNNHTWRQSDLAPISHTGIIKAASFSLQVTKKTRLRNRLTGNDGSQSAIRYFISPQRKTVLE